MAGRRGRRGRSGGESPRNAYAGEVANEIIEQLREQRAPWIKPWRAGAAPGAPVNAKTGRPYRGMNAMWLGMRAPDEDPRWCTYKQALELNAQVRKGSRATTIQFWQFERTEKQVDEQGREHRVRVRLDRPHVFFAKVFHASQIEGLPAYEPPSGRAALANEHANRILRDSGARIHHDQGDAAFYVPATDSIHLPPAERFHSEDLYYSTALHELGHWTGHEDRLDRGLVGFRQDRERYALEELRAEIASYMLSATLGVAHDPSQHVSYIDSWIRHLRNDANEIFRAARDAQVMHDYIIDLAPGLRKELEADTETPAVESNPRRSREEDSELTPDQV